MKIIPAISPILLLSVLSANIGTVTAIRGDVNITRGVALYQAHKGLGVEEKDSFFTSSHGSMQITFADRTVITLGKNTVFKVNEYLYSEKNRKSKAKFKFQKGFFKSITGRIGKIAPKQFSIKTKNSTIGVRGTEIIGESTKRREIILCTNGAIVVKSGKKETIAKKDEKVEVTLDPKVNYVIATATDVLVQKQVEIGIKKADDPEVIKRPKKDIVVEYKPEVKKAMIKKGIDAEKTPVVVESKITEAKKIAPIEKKSLNKGFVEDTKSFKSETELRKEVKTFIAVTVEKQKQEKIEEQKKEDKARIEKEQKPKEMKKIIKPQSRKKFTPIAPEKIEHSAIPHYNKDLSQGNYDLFNLPVDLMQESIQEWNVPMQIDKTQHGY